MAKTYDRLLESIAEAAAREPERCYRAAGLEAELHRGPQGKLLALCPFHAESSPSFQITTRGEYAGRWYCFGCNEGGGLLDFWRRRTGRNGKVTAAEIAELGNLVGLAEPVDRRGSAAPVVAQRSYEIRDAAGELVAVHHRFEHADGTKRFTWSRNGKPHLGGLRQKALPLYGLPALVKTPQTETVILVEGEKAQEALATRGFLAAGTVGNSRHLEEAVVAPLDGRRVILWPDNDPPGRDLMVSVGRTLAKGDRVPRWFTWAGAPPKGDAFDFFALGGTAAELRELLAQAPEAELYPAADFRLTDTGNAALLVEKHGRDLRYCGALGRDRDGWIAWDGRRWKAKAHHLARQIARQTADAIIGYAAGCDDDREVKKIMAHAEKSHNDAPLEAMLRCALTEPDLRADLEEFDADPYLLSCTNGTVDLRTGELREHRREDKITQLCPCLYDPAREGTSATWEAALDVWTGGDGELKRFLRQVGGLAATGCSRDERFLLFLGPTATGKSSFLNALLFTLGPDLAMTVPFDTWLRRPMTGTGRPRDDLAMLRAFRFVIALEAAEGSQLDEGTLKSFVGGDQITARGLYATEHLSFVPRATVCLSCNDMPIIRDTDAAMWRRLLTVPFGHTIPDAQRDPRVKAELTNPKVSGPAILAWMVAGAVDWYANGLVIPEAVQSATRTQQGAMDRLAEFLEAVCVRSPGATVTREALYKAYREWAEGAGLREAGASGPRVALTAQEFVERLRLQGLTEARRGKGRARAWVGIGLLADGQEALNMGD